MEVGAHPPGTFCFVELETSDMELAKRFYGELLGWKAFDVPSAGGTYSLLRRNGQDVAGLHRTGTGTNRWLCYLSVASADRTAARARELGGTVRVAPFDVPGIGRMAMLEDPAGGSVALWEARGHPGARLVDEPGAMIWHELVVHDVAAARSFYTGLLGWSAKETRVPNGSYTVFMLGNRQVANMIAIGEDWGPVKPHWQPFFAVDDCDAAVARAKALGGGLVFGPQDVPRAGRLAVLTDAGGAVFVVMRPTGGERSSGT